MNKRLWIFLPVLALIILAAGVWFYRPLPVTVTIDGVAQTIETRQRRVDAVLNAAGIGLRAEDLVEPALSARWTDAGIHILRARPVRIVTLPDGTEQTMLSAAGTTVQVLQQAGISLESGDRVLYNGASVNASTALPAGQPLTFTIHRAVEITVHDGRDTRTLRSSANTLGEALFQEGIVLLTADQVSPALTTALNGPIEVTIQRSRPLTIQFSSESLQTRAAAATVGEALAAARISIQALDYTQPTEDVPLPVDGLIRVIRVWEEVLLKQSPLPFSSTMVADPNTELDQRSVITPGEYGIQVSRQRIRYEDGQEVSRSEEAAWTAKEPVAEVRGYGTQVAVHTMDTPDGPIEYYRAVTVYATSYSPCNLGRPNYCNTLTASGAQLQKGIVAVTRAWFSWMRGARVYIPGYGFAVIGDMGGGIPGRYWIDLGYSDSDYVGWHSNVTVYFLTPVPESVPWVLP